MPVLAKINYDLTREGKDHFKWHETRAEAFWWVYSQTISLTTWPQVVSFYFARPPEDLFQEKLVAPGDPCLFGNVIGIGHGDSTIPNQTWAFDYGGLNFAMVALDTYFPVGLGRVHLFPGRQRPVFKPSDLAVPIGEDS